MGSEMCIRDREKEELSISDSAGPLCEITYGTDEQDQVEPQLDTWTECDDSSFVCFTSDAIALNNREAETFVGISQSPGETPAISSSSVEGSNTSDNLLVPSKTNTSKHHICSTCDRPFRSPSDLRRHMKQHSEKSHFSVQIAKRSLLGNIS